MAYLIKVGFKTQICEICSETGETALAAYSSVHLFSIGVHRVKRIDEIDQYLAAELQFKPKMKFSVRFITKNYLQILPVLVGIWSGTECTFLDCNHVG